MQLGGQPSDSVWSNLFEFLFRFSAVSCVLWLALLMFAYFARREIANLFVRPLLHLLSTANSLADRVWVLAIAQVNSYRPEAHRFTRFHGRSVATDIMLGGIVVGVVIIAGVMNYHLVSVPMHEVAEKLSLVGAEDSDLDATAKNLATSFIVLEAFAGLLFFEFCGITGLFNYIKNMNKNYRLALAVVMITFLSISAAFEVALALDRVDLHHQGVSSEQKENQKKRELDQKRADDAKASSSNSKKKQEALPTLLTPPHDARDLQNGGFWSLGRRFLDALSRGDVEVLFAALAPFALAIVAVPIDIAFAVFPLLVRMCAIAVLYFAEAVLRTLAWSIALFGTCFLLVYRLATFIPHWLVKAITHHWPALVKK